MAWQLFAKYMTEICPFQYSIRLAFLLHFCWKKIRLSLLKYVVVLSRNCIENEKVFSMKPYLLSPYDIYT